MATIDVDDILVSTDVAADSFTVLRRIEVVNNSGESTVTYQYFPAVGSVQPGDTQELIREEGFDTQMTSLVIYTQFQLRGVSQQAGVSYKPDQILWEGNYYEINIVKPFLNYGAGYIEAHATAINYVDLPPGAVVPNQAF